MKKSAALTRPVPREKPAPCRDKYFLRDLHQKIDLYDCKFAYFDKFAEFASHGDCEVAEKDCGQRGLPLRRLL